MSTKKIVAIVVSIVAALFLVIVLFVAAIAGSIFYSIGHSQAATTAKDYLRANQTLSRDIGEVKDFGWIVTGNINVQGSDGEARLNLKVIGERRTTNATVDLSYSNNNPWHVTHASYERDGQVINLACGDAMPGAIASHIRHSILQSQIDKHAN